MAGDHQDFAGRAGEEVCGAAISLRPGFVDTQHLAGDHRIPVDHVAARDVVCNDHPQQFRGLETTGLSPQRLVILVPSAWRGVALAEVFTMGIKAGVEPLDLWEAVRQGATGRQRTFDRLGRFLSGKNDPADFALRLLHKDVGLAVGLGREVGMPMRLANMAFEELTEAMNRGWGTRNSSSVGQPLQVERSRIEPPPSTPIGCRRSSTPTSRSKRRPANQHSTARRLRALPTDRAPAFAPTSRRVGARTPSRLDCPPLPSGTAYYT
jgi:hypothetical protein